MSQSIYENMISFIIPTYNEEKNIAKTITALKKHIPLDFEYEVIVVDHGSTDKTAELAKENGAKVFVHNAETIAGLRNFGAKKALGDIFVFIDADVCLTEDWKSEIKNVVSNLRKGNRILTGSWVCVPESAGWIERNWFRPLQSIVNTHINSGHMVVSRDLFEELKGFDEKLETGEDYDISMRAKELGIQIIDNHELKVIHEGYPKGLWEFMVREYWHGKGDAVSVKAIINSKVALLALCFIFLHAVLLCSILAPLNLYITAGSIVGILLICFSASFVKFRHEPAGVLGANIVLYYFYFLSRAASVFSGLYRGRYKKRER